MIAAAARTNYLLFVALSCLLLCFLQGEEISPSPSSSVHCFFMPPKEWGLADPRQLSPKVMVGFLGKPHKGFCPSMNLAIEETYVSLTEYLKAVKKLHEADHQNRWRELGKIKTKAGTAALTEIDTKSDAGPIRILQLIFLQEGHAYILTAASLKENFANFYQDFLESFRSLNITPDLLSVFSATPKKTLLEEKIQQINEAWLTAIKGQDKEEKALFAEKTFQELHWIPFQDFVLKECSELGPHWQLLFLRNLQEKFFSQASTLKQNRQNDTKGI
jgi:hypothetical protein